jgi:hypothetical protein
MLSCKLRESGSFEECSNQSRNMETSLFVGEVNVGESMNCDDTIGFE